MLMLHLADALTVGAALTLVYVALPRLLWPAWFRQDALGCVLAAASLQAFIGMLWSVIVASRPGLQIAVWFAIMAVPIIWNYRPARASRIAPPLDRTLVLVVMAGVALRWLHPLLTSTLGQSDAYSHLQFLRDYVAEAELRHPYYPAGFHALLALPTRLFSLDPYIMARYGGAFFGALLVLVLGRFSGASSGSPWAVRYTALLVACNPLAYLLAKTGVGVFPNQWGLVLLPFCLLGYARLRARENAPMGWRAGLLGLAVSVPLLLVDLVQVILLELLLACLRREWKFKLKAGWSFALIAVVVLAGSLPFLNLGQRSLIHTLGMLTGYQDALRSVPDAMLVTIKDYLSIKRWGFEHGLGDLVLLGLGVSFLVALVMALRKQNYPLRILALWGLLAVLQTGLGLFQFAAYQRAGWQLLAATLVLGGVLLAAIPADWARHQMRRGITLLLAVGAGLAFVLPPAHPSLHSASESDLLAVTRALSRRQMPSTASRSFAWDRPERADAFNNLDPSRWTYLLVRSFASFPTGQGDPVRAMVDTGSHLEVVSVSWPADALWPTNPSANVVIVVDDGLPLTSRSNSLFGRFNRALVHDVLDAAQGRQVANPALRQLAENHAAERPSSQRRVGGLTVWSFPATDPHP